MSLLNRRKALISAINNGLLPHGYQQVEYLESTGTQFINTGFYPNQNTNVYLDFQVTTVTASFIFGSRGNSTTAYTFNIGSGENFVTSYRSSAAVTLSSADTLRHTFIRNKSEAQLDETKINHGNVASFSASYPMVLFACHTSSNQGYLPSKTRVYSFKIYDNGKLVRDFIPCYRKADNVSGMYDVANSKFYTNSGTGNFTIGG